jgi:hypothetical protein
MCKFLVALFQLYVSISVSALAHSGTIRTRGLAYRVR